jgi:hypothetical protein
VKFPRKIVTVTAGLPKCGFETRLHGYVRHVSIDTLINARILIFLCAYTGENEMMHRIFSTPSFIQSRSMHCGFFVSRGYYSQGPPLEAAAKQ